MFLILLLFVGCEEEYKADISGHENILCIQALITDNPSENVVKVMRTYPFYEVRTEDFVAGASVELIDVEGNTYAGIETSKGIFNINHSAEAGKTYKLKVSVEGEVYESDFEELPSSPTFDSFYVKPETSVTYKYSSVGKPVENKVTGMRAFINVPVTDSLKYHRFIIDKVIEYVLLKDTIRKTIYVNGNDTIIEEVPEIMSIYCWRTNTDGGLFNVVGPIAYGSEKMIENRPLTFGGNQIGNYIEHDPEFKSEYLAGWIVKVKQIGLNENSYNYYQVLNKQLKASGKLFDAAYTQVQPNFRCVSDPVKSVIGFFELSSFNYFQFYMKSSIGNEESIYCLIDNEIIIPDKGVVRWFRPEFWRD